MILSDLKDKRVFHALKDRHRFFCNKIEKKILIS